jgi:hypothetical protein
VRDGVAGPGRQLLRDKEELCRAHGDLAYMRAEAELRAGFFLLAGLRARRWIRLTRRLGVSASVQLSPARSDAQAVILLSLGLLLALAAASTRPLARSWRGVGALAGVLIAAPGMLRELAWHRAWALVLGTLFLGSGLIAIR